MRQVTADRARSAALPSCRARPPRPRRSESCSTIASSSLAGSLGPARVVRGLGLVDLLLQIAHARLELAARALVEHRARRRRLGRAVRQLQAVHLLARPRQQLRQVEEALLMRELHREAAERQRPERSRRGGTWRAPGPAPRTRDGFRASLVRDRRRDPRGSARARDVRRPPRRLNGLTCSSHRSGSPGSAARPKPMRSWKSSRNS